MIPINVDTFAGDVSSVRIYSFPDYCPFCHNNVRPRILGGYLAHYSTLTLFFHCTGRKCQECFVGHYKPDSHNIYEVTEVGLGRPKTKVFEPSIQKVSPNFIGIYKEASIAEQTGLKNICGVGYRKALEFLIKDYAKSLAVDKAINEVIESEMLGLVISKYVTDVKVKAMAQRATWIGNDETHYVRLFADKDVSDMKKLIDLTLHWIEAEILTQELELSMEGKKKNKPTL